MSESSIYTICFVFYPSLHTPQGQVTPPTWHIHAPTRPAPPGSPAGGTSDTPSRHSWSWPAPTPHQHRNAENRSSKRLRKIACSILLEITFCWNAALNHHFIFVLNLEIVLLYDRQHRQILCLYHFPQNTANIPLCSEGRQCCFRYVSALFPSRPSDTGRGVELPIQPHSLYRSYTM